MSRGFDWHRGSGVSFVFEMVAEAEVIHYNPAVQYRCVAKEIDEIVDISAAAAAVAELGPEAAAITVNVTVSELELRKSDAILDISVKPLLFVPSVRSGSFADIGHRRYMEDEHIRIDNLSSHLGSLLRCPTPSAFYGVEVDPPLMWNWLCISS